MTTAKFDLLVIGAGIYGIQAARTYLEVHPEDAVAILEASESVGGVWSTERVYDSFWTQTPVDMAVFSDEVMGQVPEHDQYYGFFAAKHFTRYLNQYVESRVYNGISLRSRIKFSSRVVSLYKDRDTWIGNTSRNEYYAARVIDATGLTSEPNIPSIAGILNFTGSKLHHKYFAQSDVLSNPDLRHILVIGGAKSATDVAYAAAKAGKKVTWTIRRNGSGPAAFFGVNGPPGYRNSNESFYVRFFGLLLGSIFTNYSWCSRWLYATDFGTKLLQKFWAIVSQSTFEAANYDREDGKENGFYNLRPDTSLFWQNDSSSVNNRPDLLDTLAHKVKIYREDIASVAANSVTLGDENGTNIENIDAIIFATGWNNTHSHLSPDLASSLGLPSHNTLDTSLHPDEQKATAQLIRQFGILRNPPTHFTTPKTKTPSPYRLYNAICPLVDPSILFLGHVMTGNHFRVAEAQALWAVALFDGVVPSPLTRPNFGRLSVARTVAWNKLRYLDKGRSGNYFYYDVVPYSDALLDEIGVVSQRRGMFRPVWARDLDGAVEEYKEIKRMGSRKGNIGIGWRESVEGVWGLVKWAWVLL